jgi:ribosomal-protein-alanine N-acetyltransferase
MTAMDITFLPIGESLSENAELLNIPECAETLPMTVMYFASIGYVPPWIGYFVSLDGQIVGSAAFKGRPKNSRVEIAYATVPAHQNRGIGNLICRKLIEIAHDADPTVIITARTLREPNYSTRILKTNGFELAGTVSDPEDGKVWEWVYNRSQ